MLAPLDGRWCDPPSSEIEFDANRVSEFSFAVWASEWENGMKWEEMGMGNSLVQRWQETRTQEFSREGEVISRQFC